MMPRMPLVFLPTRNEFFIWDEEPCATGAAVIHELLETGAPALATVIAPARSGHVEGRALPLLPTLTHLAAQPLADLARLPASVASWAHASQLALDLASRERKVPTVVRHEGRVLARWGAALAADEDRARVAAIARSMSPAAHAVPAPGSRGRRVWTPEALLRRFLDAAMDTLVRSVVTTDSAADAQFDTDSFAERTLLDDLDGWSRPAFGLHDRLRICFRLELPAADHGDFLLVYLLQAPDDPSLIVPASEVWRGASGHLHGLGAAFHNPRQWLLEALGRAARLFAPIAQSLNEACPAQLTLDAADSWHFLNEGAAALGEAGFRVILPAELTACGQRRLRLRMRISQVTQVAGAVAGAGGFNLDESLAFDWEAALGDQPVTASELALLAKYKMPLVRHRGQWIAMDPHDLDDIRRYLKIGGGQLPAVDALVAALTGETRRDGMPVEVVASGGFAELLNRLRDTDAVTGIAPRALHGTLRPYQARGLAWLATMGRLGLGACLADDMGLGKTVQLIAFLLYRMELTPDDHRPALLVAPTSVIGNWEREIARFAPSLSSVAHYGPDRARDAATIARGAGTLVLTSYGLLRRDAGLLADVEWSTVTLDEAQNIKNAASATAKAARGLRAAHRFALTGTPVENRLAELWSILEFANPGLLGPLEAFLREYAVPIERYGNEHAADRLKRLVSPFLLRRLKSDPKIIRDLPPKQEMNVICTLTREQASLYQAVVDDELRRIEDVEGIERSGRVVALLTFLKQICNHPAQYLGESGPLRGRSGKLERITAMLEEVVASGDRALIFTQYTAMGERLKAHLAGMLGIEVAFLHGGTSRRARDEMVRRFQEDADGPQLFVLSVKAGGTGLNLTAANHVFHFDRWWNPAVEDQATDRAYRIGQKRNVQVYKMVCAGTIEEKVDALIAQKRGLAARIVGSGERWITELGNRELRELISLSAQAIVDDEAPTRRPLRPASGCRV